MKKLLSFCCLLFICFQLSAQDDEYQRLVRERQELIKEYEFLNAQNSNFWGKKSKKDLMKIIDNLKAIIKKDTEIINSVQASYVKRNADLTVKTEKLQTERKADTRMISENIFEMKRQVANLETRDKQRLQKIKELEDRLQETKAAKTEHDMITVFATLVSLFLLFYVIRLRTKLTHKRGR
jgi:CRISPR/Cas system-associated endoribonuclease Cas2